MTDGHKHREFRVKEDGLAFKILLIPIWRSKNLKRIDKSRFVYRDRNYQATKPYEDGYYRLTILGVLHGLFGLTLVYKEAA